MAAQVASRAESIEEASALDQRIAEASDELRRRLTTLPKAAIVLGSGLGELAELLDADGRDAVPYAEIPNVPDTSIGGHAGELTVGRAHGMPFAVLSGRAHGYEGYSHREITILVRALFALGLQTLIVTNAAGALDPTYEPGDLMVMRDMINLSGDNPLRGPNLDRFGTRFPAMTDAFDRRLVAAARRAAADAGVPLHEGVYVMLAGPSYETRAEMRMLRILGADAVGMSTVPEVIVARHAGVRVIGFSVITNVEPAEDGPGATHEDVMDVSRRGAARLRSVLDRVIPELD